MRVLAMIARPDIIVKSEGEEPVAIVEIMNRRELTPAVAQQIRRNLLVHGLARQIGFFLLLSQDRGYVWTPLSRDSVDSPPDGEFSMHEVVNYYLPVDDPHRRFQKPELELIVMQWLGKLATNGNLPYSTEPERVLGELGFVNAVRDGSVLVEPEA